MDTLNLSNHRQYYSLRTKTITLAFHDQTPTAPTPISILITLLSTFKIDFPGPSLQDPLPLPFASHIPPLERLFNAFSYLTVLSASCWGLGDYTMSPFSISRAHKRLSPVPSRTYSCLLGRLTLFGISSVSWVFRTPASSHWNLPKASLCSGVPERQGTLSTQSASQALSELTHREGMEIRALWKSSRASKNPLVPF